jgi:hypothetical protein
MLQNNARFYNENTKNLTSFDVFIEFLDKKKAKAW